MYVQFLYIKVKFILISHFIQIVKNCIFTEIKNPILKIKKEDIFTICKSARNIRGNKKNALNV